MKPVIQVRNLSKRYRIGLKESRKDTFVGQIGAALRAPIDNFRKLRSLGKFKDEDESVFWALRDINFDVQQGEVLGIIGHNGAGKSTLLKILSRITEPTNGEVRIKGRVAALLEVGTGFHQELSGRENIYMNGTILGMTRREIDWKLDEIVDFSGVEKYIDTPVKFYSSGMKVRLGFAVAAHLEPEILVIDEVLAVGDAEFQKKCLGKMKEASVSGRTVLFVSHNMAPVSDLCKFCLLLENGRATYHEDVSIAINNYFKEDNLLKFVNESLNLITPDLEYIELDEENLTNGSIKLMMRYNSPYKLDSIIPGVVVKNSMGVPIFGTNTRMHPTETMNLSNSGVITLLIDDVPLLSGEYQLSVYLGDKYKDFQTYEDILRFSFISKHVVNSKVPDQRQIGSINIKNANWAINQ